MWAGLRRPSGGGPPPWFIVLFVCLALGFEVLFLFVLQGTRAFDALLALDAAASEWVLRAIGVEVSRGGATLSIAGRSLDVMRGCDGVEPAGLFAIALIAFPMPLARKLIGLLVGVALLLALNVVRIVTLCLLYRWNLRVFSEAHHWFWPLGMIAAALVLWLFWTRERVRAA